MTGLNTYTHIYKPSGWSCDHWWLSFCFSQHIQNNLNFQLAAYSCHKSVCELPDEAMCLQASVTRPSRGEKVPVRCHRLLHLQASLWASSLWGYSRSQPPCGGLCYWDPKPPTEHDLELHHNCFSVMSQQSECFFSRCSATLNISETVDALMK